jgi:YVTN family beta-propeller protein
MAFPRSLPALMNSLLFPTGALLLLIGAISTPARAQSVTFAGVQTTVTVGFEPSSVAVDSANGEIYVANYGSNTVSVINGATNTVVATIPVGANPSSVAVDSASGEIYAANYGGGTVTVINGPTNTVVATIAVGANPSSVAVDSAIGEIYVGNYGSNTVTVINDSTNTVVGSAIPVGANPSSVAVDVLSGEIFVGNYGSNTVTVINDSTNTVVGSAIPVGAGPSSVAVDAPSGEIYVANYGSSTLTVLMASLGAAAVNFGNVNICPAGQTTPAPCSQTLTLNYNVNADVTFAANPTVVTQGAPNLDFTLSSTTCTGAVSAGSSCTVNVTFAPLAPGVRMGAVQLLDNSSNLLVTTMIPGIGQGPAIAFGPGAQTTVASGLSDPYGVAVDAAGDVFIADTENNRVVEVPVGGGPQTTVGTGLALPTGVAVDGAGDVIIADYSNSRVVVVPYAGNGAYGAQTTVGSGVSFPRGVAVDGAGDVFIADSSNNRVVEVAVGGSAQITVGTGLSYPQGVAVDGAGDVFIADSGNNRVVEVPASSGVQTTVGTGLNYPQGVAVDGVGDVFIADSANNRVVEVPVGGGTQTPVGIANTPFSVAVDGAGDIFIPNSAGGDQVVEVQRSQRPSLTFASTTVGSTSSDSPQSVTIQSIGNQPLNAIAPGLIVGGPNFVQVPGSGTPADCNGSFALTPGATCNLSISFEPQSTGLLTSTATFTDNALNSTPPATQSMALQGTGTPVKVATSTFMTIYDATTGSPWSGTEGAGASSYASAAVAPGGRGPAPTGTVGYTMYPDGACTGAGPESTVTLVGGFVPNSGPSAPLAAASYSFVATYSGDANYDSSTSVCTPFAVNRAPTTTTVGSSVNPSTAGQSVTFTATVGGGYSPTGTVGFTSAIAPISGCSAVMLSSGAAQCTTSALPVGTYAIVATYSGDSNNDGSTATLTGGQQVNPAAVQIAITTSPANLLVSADGGPFTAAPLVETWIPGSTHTIATSSPQPGAPGVQYVWSGWSDGSAISHTITVPSSGTTYTAAFNAQYQLTTAANPSNGGTVSPPSGNFYAAGTMVSLVATANPSFTFSRWTGNVANVSSASTFVTMSAPETVIANFSALTTTALVSSSNPSTYGDSVTFTATVASSGNGTPNGNVSFKAGNASLGVVNLVGGSASLTTSALNAGSHTITAHYFGSTRYAASSSALTQTVNKAATTTIITNASPDPSTYGQPVTFTATVSTSAGSAGGKVVFKRAAIVLGGGTLSGGAVSYTTTATQLPAGTEAITAVYNGDANHAASTSVAYMQTVNKAATTTVVVTSGSPSTSGSPVTFTATVGSSVSAAPGGVTFKDGSTLLGTVALSGGTAIFTTSGLAVGTHTIHAHYNGNGDYAVSSGQVEQLVQ